MKSFGVNPLHLAGGMAVWLLWLSASYAGLSLACRFAPPPPDQGIWNWVNGTLLGFTLLTAFLLLILALRCWRRRKADERVGEEGAYTRRFVAVLAAALYLAAAVSTVAAGVPLIMLPPCI